MVFAWVWLCIPAAIVHPCPSQATKMLACEHPSAVFLWCLVACEMRVTVSQNVAVVGWGPAVNPLCQCVSNACPRRGALCLALDPCCDDCLILLLLLLLRWIRRSGRIRASPSLQPTSRDRTCTGQTVSVSRHAGMGHRHGLGTPERLSVKHNHRLGTREDMGEQRTSKPWIYELPSLRAHGRSCYVHVMFTFSDLPEQSRVHTCRPDLP